MSHNPYPTPSTLPIYLVQRVVIHVIFIYIITLDHPVYSFLGQDKFVPKTKTILLDSFNCDSAIPAEGRVTLVYIMGSYQHLNNFFLFISFEEIVKYFFPYPCEQVILTSRQFQPFHYLKTMYLG